MYRIEYLDHLKGFTMLLIVWLHCIQFVFGETNDNCIFSNVVAFHMPILMIVSGFFFHRKIIHDLSIWTIFKKQFQRLIVPSCTFGLIGIIIKLVIINKWGVILLLYLPLSYWFLSSLFLCSMLYLIVNRLFKRFIDFYPFVVILSLVSIIFNLSEFLTFFIPFFGVGIIFAKNNISFNIKYHVLLFIGVLIMLLMWQYKYSIYVTPNPSIFNINTEQISAYFIRLIWGVGISYGLICLFNVYETYIPFKSFWATLSRNSLCIYLIHMTFLPMLQYYNIITINNQWVISILSLIIALVIIIMINKLISWIRKSNSLSFLLLGEY